MNLNKFADYLTGAWNSFCFHIKQNYKKILINYAIFLGIFTILLLCDQMVKTFVWGHSNVHDGKEIDGKLLVEYNGNWIDPESIVPKQGQWINFHGIIGIRYIWHKGVTFLPKGVSIILIQILSMMIFLCILCVPLFTNKIILLVLLSSIAAGDMGNMLDRFIFKGYVKDMLYFPFWDKGTFNLADAFVVIGAVSFASYFIFEFIMELIQRRKKDNIVEIDSN
ncbi:signal peptidase II [Mycoplasmopsis pullorum]|uniref:signal peptidase II n=1 Tax=Mycoplasmopsis pullorum TaxID=48003 RepID=UPI0015D5B055|nr:signal peptidase II [Mycoplasmopsis pullorum]